MRVETTLVTQTAASGSVVIAANVVRCRFVDCIFLLPILLFSPLAAVVVVVVVVVVEKRNERRIERALGEEREREKQ